MAPSSRPLPDAVVEAQDRFIRAWGQMAGAWGVSRTMAEAHALLYIVGDSMNTDEVMDRLSISRGNASMSLRALVDWGLAARVHRRGDRKEYFLAEQDAWAMLRTIIRERKKRELDPLLASLHEIRDLTAPSRAGPQSAPVREHNTRLDAMLEFVAILDVLAEHASGADSDSLLQAARLLTEQTGAERG